MKKKKVKEIGITALYERLSRDDDGDGDSNSIVHQKQMLETYAKEHGFINLHHYTDDGWSGASFDRPAWNELVSGVKDGKITTVIVKDLSRVGRDHLQVGFFTDILFREKEVRFIAVGNSIDSNDQQSNEFAPFLNIMNEWYVRDTSKKIKAVLKSRGMSGKAHTSNSPCYGYVKDPENPDHWVVDEEAAAIVRRIFQMSIVNLRLPDGETRRKGIDSTKYLWVAKLRCRCGSSYRIFNWRKLKDGTPVFGYQCNMRTVNPTRSFVLEHNMTQQLSCDAISIPEWKLELMAKKIFEKVWGNQNKAILRACKMIESCQNGKAATRMSAAPIQSKIEKIKKRKLNYAAMRADGELPREEYQALCKQADDEITRLEQELKALSPEPEPQTVSSDLKAIYDFLSQKVDVHSARLAPELIDQFVEVVTPIADYSYRWKLNTGCKKSKEERADLMAVSEKPILTFTIDFETAKRYREANKMPHQFRRAAWTDLTVEVYL